jgi:hypothetical protein
MSQTDTPAQVEQRLSALEERLEALETTLGIVPSAQPLLGQQLTIAQGSALLHVSEEYFLHLLDQGVIPAIPDSKPHRVLLTAVLQHRHERRAALQRLAEYSEEYGLYDEEDGDASGQGHP